ncbi:arylamine N-acetyltransferase family protein [Sphingosinicella microcystinivorans]|uniref:arylamine N-acetyltransferase family protein n=1 Tax=Sphingosinicella microcystinivorans TaxID=335406 RepID=UPI0022F39B97|nr:arylamine N-acetyltransferase [Sphingosinicella microcystinivorans]WBX83603.1 arylamine N-acetyltransferase [Sphingosinicella microcystinivorans]
MLTELTPEQMDRYCARIGVPRAGAPDLERLAAIQRGHVHAFTWEVLDAFMGWPNAIDPAAAFDKMIGGTRGGWCYEMNGLLGAALAAAGFQVTRLCSGVRRADLGDAVVGNHLTLRVDLREPWLVDGGLGDAPARPIPLAVGDHREDFHDFGIEAADADWLRYRNQRFGAAPSFDFRADYTDEPQLAAQQAWLMSDDGSPFRSNLVVMRHFEGRIESIVNRTRRTVTAGGMTTEAMSGPDDLAAALGGVFGLEVPDVAAVWAKVETLPKGEFE